MQKIVICLGGYLPAKHYGGPVTSIANLVQMLGDRFDFYIISNNHELGEKKPLQGIKYGWNQVGKAKVCYIDESLYCKAYFQNILRELKPIAVYLSSIFHYTLNSPVIRAARSMRIPVILAPRGELCKNAFQMKSFKKRIFISIVNLFCLFRGVFFHATSQEEYDAIIHFLKVDQSKLFLLPNISCALDPYISNSKEPGKLRVVFISRIQRKKNLLFAINVILKVKCNIEFDIYGPIEQHEYWDECQQLIKSANKNIAIHYKGVLDPGISKDIFSKYHCFIFPTLSENYGHVIAEAISVGCPVLLSKGTTPWDDIMGNGGFILRLDRPSEWSETLEKLSEMDQKSFDDLRHRLQIFAKEKLCANELVEQYYRMFCVGGVQN